MGTTNIRDEEQYKESTEHVMIFFILILLISVVYLAYKNKKIQRDVSYDVMYNTFCDNMCITKVGIINTNEF